MLLIIGNSDGWRYESCDLRWRKAGEDEGKEVKGVAEGRCIPLKDDADCTFL